MAQESASPDRKQLVCTIDEALQGTTISLQGRITGPAVQGRYNMRVRKIGSGGSSDITQGGEFRVEPGVDARLGRVGLGLEQGARYEAVLTLTVDSHTYTCEAFGPGPRPL